MEPTASRNLGLLHTVVGLPHVAQGGRTLPQVGLPHWGFCFACHCRRVARIVFDLPCCTLVANGTLRPSGRSRLRSLTGVKRTSSWCAQIVAFDPFRHFARSNCCAAQRVLWVAERRGARKIKPASKNYQEPLNGKLPPLRYPWRLMLLGPGAIVDAAT